MNSTKPQRGSLQPGAYSLKPVFTDRLGTVRARGTGTTLTRTSHYPFGEEIGGATASDQYKFASTYRDSSSGLDYAVNRYYASGMGRFLTTDRGPAHLADPQSLNRYAYAADDPANYSDPNGLSPSEWTQSDWCIVGLPLGADPMQWFAHCTGGSGWDGMVVVNYSLDGGGGGPARPKVQVDNPSKTGANQTKILDTLEYLLNSLNDDCKTFFGSQFDSYVGGMIGDRSNPESAYIAHGSLRGLPTTAAVTGGSDSDISTPPGYAATVINDDGAFFNAGFNVSNGRLQGGTAQAQRAILLHEIGHGLGLLENDFGNQAAVDRNDNRIWDKCGKTIKP